MNAADTNIVVRILTRDDERQALIADRFIEGGSWVPIVALAEAIWVLRRVYGAKPGDVAKGVGMLLNHESLVLQDSDAVESALDLYRSRTSLGFSDCLILELARKSGHVPLGTFDRNFGKVSGTQIL
jgi:predicted nucleic-acid-binding protein